MLGPRSRVSGSGKEVSGEQVVEIVEGPGVDLGVVAPVDGPVLAQLVEGRHLAAGGLYHLCPVPRAFEAIPFDGLAQLSPYPPTMRYLLDPFRDATLRFAQTGLALNVADLFIAAGSQAGRNGLKHGECENTFADLRRAFLSFRSSCDTGGVLDAVAWARELIRVVANDPGLPSQARRCAADLELVAASEPAIVLERLEKLRQVVVPQLASWPPLCDYARCVPVERFWRYHIRPSIRDVFEDGEDYRVYLETSANPAAVARAHLSGGVLVEAPYSWLVPASRIAGLNGGQTKTVLKINDEPPIW